MSKSYDFNEQECKCCHEWWYSSEIKQDLCPNCYDYFKQLKQQLAEKDCRIEELEGQFAYECECNKQLVELQKQLTEKDKEKTQLAIQELEKVKINLKDRITMMGNKEHSYLQKVVSWIDVCDQINQQIKELKGE